MNIELGLVIFFGAMAAWMGLTTPKFREMIFGYAVLLGVIGVILTFITGQAPSSHYGPP